MFAKNREICKDFWIVFIEKAYFLSDFSQFDILFGESFT